MRRPPWRGGKTYRVQSGPVLGKLHELDGGQVAGLDGGVDGQGNLREADGARVRVVGGTLDGEGVNHGVGHVLGAVIGAVGAEAQVDVDDGEGVASEPAGLEGERAARCGPVCAVFGGSYAAACRCFSPFFFHFHEFLFAVVMGAWMVSRERV